MAAVVNMGGGRCLDQQLPHPAFCSLAVSLAPPQALFVLGPVQQPFALCRPSRQQQQQEPSPTLSRRMQTVAQAVLGPAPAAGSAATACTLTQHADASSSQQSVTFCTPEPPALAPDLGPTPAFTITNQAVESNMSSNSTASSTPTSSRASHGTYLWSQQWQQQQQQNQQLQSAQQLHRPAGLKFNVLQQQVESATNWQQTAQLLQGRRKDLMLKHLSLMVAQAARQKAAEQQQTLKQLKRQERAARCKQTPGLAECWRNSSSDRGFPAPADLMLVQPTAPAAAAGLTSFLQDLAAAVHDALCQEHPELVQEAMAAAAAMAIAAAAAEAEAAEDYTAKSEDAESHKTLPNSNFSNKQQATSLLTQVPNSAGSNSSSSSVASWAGSYAAQPLAASLGNILWGFAKLNHTPAKQQLQVWVCVFERVASAADEVSFSQGMWALGQLQFWPGEDVMDSLAAGLAGRIAPAAKPAHLAAAAPAHPPNGSQTADSGTTLAAASHADVPRHQQPQPLQHRDQLRAHTVGPSGSASNSQKQQVPSQQHRAWQQQLWKQQQPLGSRALSNILWSFAALGYVPTSNVLQAVWTGSVDALSRAAPQALCNMIWAITSLDIVPTLDWMQAWAAAALPRLQQWNAADAANAAWAIGKIASSLSMRHLVPDLPFCLALMRAGRTAAVSAAPRELVCMAWGLTAAGVAFSETFTDRLLVEVAAKRTHFKAREWSLLLAVLAKQGVTPPFKWQRSSQAVMQQRLRFMTALDFSMAIWGIAQLGVTPRQAWKDRFFAESYCQLFFLSPRHTCALVWGLGRLHWRPPREWQDRLFLETYTKLAGFRAAELAGTLHGLAQLQLQPPLQWMWQCTAVMSVAAPDMSTQELTTCLWALAKLRYRPPEPWLAALTDRAAKLMPHAWKQRLLGFRSQAQQQEQQQHQQSLSSNQQYGNAANDRDVSEGQALHQWQQAQQADKTAANARRRRQQLLQQVQQVSKQQHKQPPMGTVPERHSKQDQQHERLLLQMRGDLALLSKRQRQQQQQGQWDPDTGDAAAFGDDANHLPFHQIAGADPFSQHSLGAAAFHQLSDRQRQQQQQHQQLKPVGRLLGKGDVKVIMATLAELQFQLPGDHPLGIVARQLVDSKHRHFITSASITNPRSHERDTGSNNLTFIPASNNRSRRLVVDGRDGATNRDSSAYHSTTNSRTAQPTGNNSSRHGAEPVDLHVAPSTALARRRRHGRRFSASI